MKEVFEALLKVEKEAAIVAVVEKHANGEKHYHIILILKRGLSKNTYRKTIRDLFPSMRGHGLDVSGVRNIKFTVKYILKDVTDTKSIFFHNMLLDDFLKLSGSVEVCVYFSILNFSGRFEEWKNSSLSNRITYYSCPKKIILIWDDVQKAKIKSFVSLKDSFETYVIPEQDKIGVLKTDIPFFQCVLVIKFCVILFTPHCWKRTNLLISGDPNTGKTSFFKKFEAVFMNSFYWAPARIGDLRGFDPKHELIILDDVISTGNKWPLAMLLKMLGREGFKGDSKMKLIVDIPTGVPVAVITNFSELFLRSPPIAQRLIHVSLAKHFSWVSISDRMFKLIINLAWDGVKIITKEEVELWNYCGSGQRLTKSQTVQVRQLQLAINTLLNRGNNIQSDFIKEGGPLVTLSEIKNYPKRATELLSISDKE